MAVRADDVYWDGEGGTDKDWSNASNWTGDALPGATDAAHIGSAALTPAEARVTTPDAVCATLGIAQEEGHAGTLTVALGGVLTVSDAITVGAHRFQGSAALTQTGGTIQGDGTLQIKGIDPLTHNYTFSGGTLAIAAVELGIHGMGHWEGGTWNINEELTYGGTITHYRYTKEDSAKPAVRFRAREHWRSDP